MKMQTIKPYSDDLMYFDEASGHYVLREQALIRQGVDLRSRLAFTKAENATYIINGLLQTASDMIYDYIHDFNTSNERQDYLIASIEGARPLIQKAMLQQAIYILKVGNLSLSVDDNERRKAIDYSAIRTLNTTIRELGVPITYSGACI
jgi:hypothetical protein